MSSRPIDEKIVQLTLDNKQFEKNAEQSIETFKEMNRSMSHSTVDLSGIQNAVQKCADRFSLMGNISQEIFERIAIKAVDVGERITRALTIQGAVDGYSEYQLKLESIQTIMNNTGRNIKDVSTALDELNTYADQTVFVFADMTRQIGDVTASSGMALEDAVAAIKGAYNAAAFFGKGSTQATMAMTQFSQAIAANKMQLIDWKSIQTDGLGGPTMQRALVAAAQKTGKLTMSYDELIKKFGSFREAISGKESISDMIDAEAIQLALQAFADPKIAKELSQYDKSLKNVAKTATDSATKIRSFGKLVETVGESIGSGWAHTWETLIGDYEEAGNLWTAIGTPILNFTEKWSQTRNDLLDGWDELGGRTALLNGLANCFKLLSNVITPVKNASVSLFPKVTSENLADLTKKFEEFTNKFKDFDFSKWNAFWDGLNGKLKAFKDSLTDTNNFVGRTFAKIKSFFSGFKLSFGGLGDFVKKTGKGLKDNLSFETILKGGGILLLAKNIGTLIQGFRNLYDTVGLLGIVKRTFEDGGILGVLTGKGENIEDAKSVFEVLSEGFGNLGTGLKLAGLAGLMFAVSQVAKAINILGSMDTDKVTQAMTTISIVFGELFAVTKFTKSNLGGALSMVLIANAVKGVALAIAGLSLLDPEKVSNSVGAIGIALAELVAAVKLLDDTSSLAGGATLIEIAGAIDILTVSIAALSLIEPEKIGTSLGAIGVALAELVAATEGLSLIEGPFKAFLGGGTLNLVASAVDILTVSLVALSAVDPEKLGMSLGVLAVALTEIVAASYALEGAVVGIVALAGAGFALSLIGAAMLEFATACAIMQTVNWDKVGYNFLIALTQIGTGLMAFTMAIPGALALTIASPGLVALAGSLAILQGLDLQGVGTSLANCLTGLAFGLTLMSLAIPGALALTIASGGLVALAGAIQMMSGTDVMGIGTGLGTLLSAMAVGLTLMIAALPGALALLIAAPALNILSKSLIALQAANLSQISSGLLDLLASLAGGLTAMIIALPGALALLVAAPAITILADSLKEMKSLNLVTIGNGLKTVMEALAGGLTAMILSGSGASSLKTVAPALGVLAESLKKINGMPLRSLGENIERFLTCLAGGLSDMIMKGNGADALSKAAPALVILGDALTKMKEIKFGNIAGDIYGVLTNIAKGVNEMNSATKGAEAMEIIAPAMVTLGESIKELDGIKMDGIKKKLEDVLGTLSTAANDMIDAQTGADALNSIIPNLSELFKAMQEITGIDIKDGFGSRIKTVMEGIANGVALMSGNESGADSVAKICAPLIDLANALKILSEVKLVGATGEKLKTALTHIAGGVREFFGAGDGSEQVAICADGVRKISTAIKDLSEIDNVSTIGFGIGYALEQIGEAMMHFNNTSGAKDLQSVADGVSALTDAIVKVKDMDNISTIGFGIGYALEHIGEGTNTITNTNGVKQLPTLSDGVSKLCDAFNKVKELTNISTIGFGIGYALQQISGGISGMKNNAAAQNLPTIATGINTLGDTFLALQEMDNISTVGFGIGYALKQIGEAVATFQNSTAGATVLSTAATGIQEIMDVLVKVNETKINMSTEGPLQSVNTFIATLLGTVQNNQEQVGQISELGSGIDIFTQAVTDLVAEAGELQTTTETINSIDVTGFTSSMEAIRTSVTDYIGGAFTDLQTNIENMIGYIDTSSGNVSSSMEELGSSAVNALKKSASKSKGSNIGTTLVKGFCSGVNSAAGSAKTAAGALGSGAMGALGQAASYNQAHNSGTYFTQGFIDGMGSLMQRVIDKATAIGKAAVNALKRAIDEGSPSKETRKSGVNYDLGFIGGMDSMKERVAEVAASIGTAATDALDKQSPLNPEAAPLIDMNAMNSRMSINGMGLMSPSFGSIQNDLSPMINRLTEMQETIASSYEALASTVNSINEKFDALMNRDTEIAIYTSGKKVASTIAKDMNIELGKLARRKVR